MRPLTFVALAASAAGFAPAVAQTVPDSDPYYGVAPDHPPPPPPHMRAAPPPGTTWHASPAPMDRWMPPPPPQMRGEAGPPPTAPDQRVVVRRYVRDGAPDAGPAMHGPDGQQRVVVRRYVREEGPGPDVHGRDDHGSMMDRPMPPLQGWAHGPRGDHGYEGHGYADGEFSPGARGYRWSERGYGPEMYGGPDVRVYVAHPPMMAPPPCARGCAGPPPAYGYGPPMLRYGPVLVSETVVTEPPVVEQRTYVTYVTERVRVAPRHHRRRCGCRAAPPEVLGERG
jgi:hypothetical protein